MGKESKEFRESKDRVLRNLKRNKGKKLELNPNYNPPWRRKQDKK